MKRRQYTRNHTYRVTVEMVPSLVLEHPRGLCLDAALPAPMREWAFNRVLASGDDQRTRYRIRVYETNYEALSQQTYSLRAFYESIVSEHLPSCSEL